MYNRLLRGKQEVRRRVYIYIYRSRLLQNERGRSRVIRLSMCLNHKAEYVNCEYYKTSSVQSYTTLYVAYKFSVRLHYSIVCIILGFASIVCSLYVTCRQYCTVSIWCVCVCV